MNRSSSCVTFRKAQNSLKKRLYSVLESCLERFECRAADEFRFTSPQFDEGIPPFACEFACQPSQSHILAAADEDGRVLIQNTNTAQNPVLKEWSAHKNAIFDISWSSCEPRLVTASGDQSAALWDVQRAACLATFKQHRCSLKSVSFRPGDSHVFATGARDGSIMMWDDRCEKRGKGTSQFPVAVIDEAHIDWTKKAQPKRRKKLASNLPSIDSSHSVSVVLFQKEDTLLSAGAADGIVKVWDMRMLKKVKTSCTAPSHQFPYGGTSNRKRGFSSLALSSTRTQLFASCTDSIIYEYDLSGVLGQQPVSCYRSHMNSTFFVRATVSPDDLFLISGSSDSKAYIWKIGEPESPPMTLLGHNAEVTSVAWCPDDFTKVVTCSDDNTMRIWKLSPNSADDDSLSRVIGKAKRCEKIASLENKENSEVCGSIQPTGSSWSPVGRSTLSGRNGGGESSPSPGRSLPGSPMPASTKKRKFSLRDWVTSPSRGRPSPVLPSSGHPSPILSSKRIRSMSTPCSSSEVLTLNGSPRGNEKDGAAARKKRNCDSNDLTIVSKKRLCLIECESMLRVDKETVSVIEGMTPLDKGTVSSSPKSNEFSSSKDSVKERAQGSLQQEAASTNAELVADSKADKDDITNEDGLDKENSGATKRKSQSPSKKGVAGQRSPLKDDIPMNRASIHSTSLPVKKNLAISFPESFVTKPTQSDAGSPRRVHKQLTLERVINDGKIRQLQKKTMKRRGSAGTIEGYFMPLIKRNKSEL